MTHATGTQSVRTAGRIVTLITVLGAGAVPFFFLLPRPVTLIIIAITGLLLVAALVLRDPAAMQVTLLILFLAAWSLIAGISVWPSLIVPLLVYAGVVAVIPSLRRSVHWLQKGTFDRTVWALVGLTVLASSAALLLWFSIGKPDLRHFLKSLLSWSPVLLPLQGLGFAALNAAMEESLFRGVLMQGLDEALGEGGLSVFLQALVFGLFHIQGIPGGWIGIIMATVYGLMLGAIRRRSRGILAPYLTHVFADLVIFSILALGVK